MASRGMTCGVGLSSNNFHVVLTSTVANTTIIALNSIAVHEDHRRKGIAKKLTAWGLDAAKKQDKDVWLVAMEEGMYVYKALGFETLAIGSRCGEAQYIMFLEQTA